MLEQNSYKSPVRKLVNFFEKSRDNWKEKYQLNKNVVKIPHHSYSATTICLMLQLVVLNAAVSLRGSARVLTIFNTVLGEPLARVPCWFSVRSWLLRAGYYKLMRAKTIADDCCWIMDHTIQLGKTKCLLVLGIRLLELPKGRSLQYQDLEPIDCNYT